MSQKSNTAELDDETPPEFTGIPRRRPIRKAADADQPTIPDLRKPGAVKTLARTKKSNEWEIAKRRRDIRTMRLRGKSYAEIAKELGISTFTVKRDLDAISKEAVQRVDDIEQKHFIGEMLLTFDEVERQAWDEFHNCIPGTKQRIAALETVRTTANDKFKVATEVGLIQRAAQEVKHTHQSLPLDDGTKQVIIKALLESQLKPQFLLPTPDTEHAPGKNIEVNPVSAPPRAAAPVQEAVIVEPAPVEAPAPLAASESEAEVVRKLVGLGLSVDDAQKHTKVKPPGD